MKKDLLGSGFGGPAYQGVHITAHVDTPDDSVAFKPVEHQLRLSDCTDSVKFVAKEAMFITG
eukprot:CAMPEP_0176396836 /NCGR_PEP_ID=MMETSP0126-20121128/44591_1 /TAXON_ID=141414 ORGANISM="Strombidinopsis acuminatum, Strain SPMC142" /NCGR_SAMPLE_ID=MMETSP0126 /ASSEMBLY_ACC=CAM_ASM_000229 /LENGTH=61 /DNA_ID=CAMNT_0017770681 /DNA_START=229 /DNA_END=413 /DNA_ORIENTATION=+